jgi:hypothetical protein
MRFTATKRERMERNCHNVGALAGVYVLRGGNSAPIQTVGAVLQSSVAEATKEDDIKRPCVVLVVALDVLL